MGNRVRNPRPHGIIIPHGDAPAAGPGPAYRQHAPVLRLYARQWPATADDAVQDAFVKLAQQSPPPERVLPWLYRVVRNAALAAQRSASRRRQRESVAGVREAWFATADDQLDARDATHAASPN